MLPFCRLCKNDQPFARLKNELLYFFDTKFRKVGQTVWHFTHSRCLDGCMSQIILALLSNCSLDYSKSFLVIKYQAITGNLRDLLSSARVTTFDFAETVVQRRHLLFIKKTFIMVFMFIFFLSFSLSKVHKDRWSRICIAVGGHCWTGEKIWHFMCWKYAS